MCTFLRVTYMILTGEWWFGEKKYVRGVHFLKCPLIRDFTTFISFPFSRAWVGYQYSFSRTTLLVFVVPKTIFCLSDMVDSEGKRTGEIWNYFAYQRAKLLAGNKIMYTISLYLQITSYISPSPKPFGNETTKILGTYHPQFLAILQRCPSYLQELLEV